MQKVASPLPANGGVAFSNDGPRVYYLSGDVKDAAAAAGARFRKA